MPLTLTASAELAAAPDSLLERCAGGDQLAWSRLYAAHGATARRFLHLMGVEQHAVDDAVQEVFLEAFRFLPKFRGDCAFKTWLYRLCATQARRACRRDRIRRVLDAVLHREAPPSITLGEIEADRAARLVRDALDTLSADERMAFALYELEGVSGREIAKIASCPEATVWRRLHYARRKFCAFVQERERAP